MAIDLSRFSAVLLDLDGTIYHEEYPLPGALDLVRMLQSRHIKYACLSNSTNSPQRTQKMLAKMGLPIDADHIYTAAAAACDYLLAQRSDRGHRPRIFNLSNAAVEEMLDEQVDWVKHATDPCDAIIVGTLTNELATPDRQRIALALARRGARVLGICGDRVYPSPRGMEFGAGAHAWLIAYAAGVEPIFTGKPQESFFRTLCDRIKVDPKNCLLVGDNLESDVAGAKRVGMKTVLVLTGVAKQADVEQLPIEARPDWIAADLPELLA
jgi:HAD superfamily hydrolase (TIGR01450 family)